MLESQPEALGEKEGLFFCTMPEFSGTLTTHYSAFTAHHSPLTTHCSLLTTHYSLLTTHYSLLTTTPRWRGCRRSRHSSQ